MGSRDDKEWRDGILMSQLLSLQLLPRSLSALMMSVQRKGKRKPVLPVDIGGGRLRGLFGFNSGVAGDR